MKTSKTIAWLAGVLGVLASLWFAPPAAAQPTGLGDEWKPVETERLDSMRGGFVSPSGLVASFGIERLVLVNGATVSTMRLHVPDVGRLTADQAATLATLNETRIIQVGGGMVVVPGGSGGLVIQNALDGQSISAMTTINASVNTLGMFQDINLGSTLNNALIHSAYQP